jgi:hypothetical protein
MEEQQFAGILKDLLQGKAFVRSAGIALDDIEGFTHAGGSAYSASFSAIDAVIAAELDYQLLQTDFDLGKVFGHVARELGPNSRELRELLATWEDEMVEPDHEGGGEHDPLPDNVRRLGP